MLNRRLMLSSGLLATTAAVVSDSAARAEDNCSGYQGFNFRPPTVPSETEAKGDGPVPGVEIAKAFRLMMKAPHGIVPIDIANYFSQLNVKSEGKIGGAQRLFREEWPTPGPANPMIVGFFAATQLLPSGDQTAWCAAFVNYCLWAAGKLGTASAASASFRKLRDIPSTGSPNTGDVAVFRESGSGGNDPDGKGHVGFFVAPSDVTSGKYPARPEAIQRYQQSPSSYVWVLGGNQQGGDAGSTGGVKAAPIPRDGSLQLLGFVSIGKFQKIPEA